MKKDLFVLLASAGETPAVVSGLRFHSVMHIRAPPTAQRQDAELLYSKVETVETLELQINALRCVLEKNLQAAQVKSLVFLYFFDVENPLKDQIRF